MLPRPRGLRSLKMGKYIPEWPEDFSLWQNSFGFYPNSLSYLLVLINCCSGFKITNIFFKSDYTYSTWDSQRTITDLTVDEACHTSLWEIRGIIKHIFHLGGIPQPNLPFIFHNSQSYTRHHKERERIMRPVEAKPSLGHYAKMFLTMMGC